MQSCYINATLHLQLLTWIILISVALRRGSFGFYAKFFVPFYKIWHILSIWGIFAVTTFLVNPSKILWICLSTKLNSHIMYHACFAIITMSPTWVSGVLKSLRFEPSIWRRKSCWKRYFRINYTIYDSNLIKTAMQTLNT